MVARANNLRHRKKESEPLHSISEYMQCRGISVEMLAKLSDLDPKKVKEIIAPGSDPLISEVLTIHRAVNKLGGCSIGDFFSNDFRPTNSERQQLLRIQVATEALIRTLAGSDSESSDFDDDFGGDNSEAAEPVQGGNRKAISFCSQILQVLDKIAQETHIPGNINGSYTANPFGGERDARLHLIDRWGFECGKRQFYDLLEDPNDPRTVKISDPSHDFRLSELKTLRELCFKTVGEGSMIRLADLINAPESRNPYELESTAVRFETKVIEIGHICFALAKVKDLPAECNQAITVIKSALDVLRPGWLDRARDSKYARTGGSGARIARRELDPIRLPRDTGFDS